MRRERQVKRGRVGGREGEGKIEKERKNWSVEGERWTESQLFKISCPFI